MIGNSVEEQKETPRILDELSRSNSAKPAGRQHTTARKRFIVILCIFAALIAGAGLLGFQQWALLTRLADLDAQNTRLSSTLADQSSEINQLRAAQSDSLAALPVDDTLLRDTLLSELQILLNTEIANLQQQLIALQQAQNLASKDANLEWKILEAEYLLGIASQKLQLQDDVTSAIALLEKADAALLASGSNSVFEARQAIADDLSSLREITPIDSPGIFLRIDALIDQVSSVDLLASMRDRFQSEQRSESQAVTAEVDGSGAIDSTLDFLSSVFVWRERDNVSVAMIAPGQDTLIKQNLQLVLEQVQLAVLLRDAELYRHNLENGIDGLSRYTARDSALNQSLLSSLNELLEIDIDPPLPTLESALNAVNQLTASIR